MRLVLALVAALLALPSVPEAQASPHGVFARHGKRRHKHKRHRKHARAKHRKARRSVEL